MKRNPFASFAWAAGFLAIALTHCQEGPRRMEPHTPNTRPPRYADFSVQEGTMGLNEYIHVFQEPGGNLCARAFFEMPDHGGQTDSYKPVDWKQNVQAGVALRGSNGGARTTEIPNYWATWKELGVLKALSIYQENPLSLPMDPQDSLIDGPLLDLDGKLHVYFLRKAPDGYDLWEHVFTGNAKQRGHASTAKLAFIAGEPLFIRADPVAKFVGNRDGEIKAFVDGIAVIGWLTQDGTSLRAHGAWLHGAEVQQFSSDPIAGYAPFPNQRIGLWGNADSSRLHLAWIMRRADSDTLRHAEWLVWAKKGNQNIRIDSRGLGGSKVLAAASVILRRDQSPDTYCYYLTRTGNLYEQNKTGTGKIREGVPLDYDFPIFASAQGPWEPRVDKQGEIHFYAPSWMDK